MAEVTWTPQALEDLEAICLFIARDAPQIAAVFAERAFRATDRLAAFPYSGRVVPELNMELIREIILGNYRLIYRLNQGQVQVLTVYHGARLLSPTSFQNDL
jgi:plasmid stabilization system protein ParE